MAELVNQKNWHFVVDGMHCHKCVRQIQSLADAFTDVESINVNLAENQVVARASSAFEPDKFQQKMNEAGFHAKIFSPNKDSAPKNHMALIRMAVAGACAGNIMLFSASNYAGAEGTELGPFFNWLSFALFLPVLLFSSYPLLKNSVISLYNKKISVDIPLAIAIVSASAMSFINLVLGSSEIYFDSMAMFIFFLLASRYAMARMQLKYLRPVSVNDLVNRQSVMVLSGASLGPKEISKLQTGDVYRLKAGDHLPVDSEVITKAVELDNAIITGESTPVRLEQFERVFAGAKLVSKTADFKVIKSLSDSRVSKLVAKINREMESLSENALLADRGAQYLTIAIVSLALISWGFFYFLNVAGGMNRILALLVVSCPCALAIATPLAHKLVVRSGLKKNILFKNVNAIENASGVDKIVFDKTGTLTEGQLHVVNWPLGEPNNLQRKIIAALEEKSQHPVAIALRRALGPVEVIELQGWQEVTGRGVSGTYKNKTYEIRSGHSSSLKEIEFLENGKVALTAELEDSIKENMCPLLERLRDQGKQLYLLTGDDQVVAEKVGSRLGFKPEEVFAKYDPEHKAEFVKKHQTGGSNVMFVGDGINDALAMSNAGISVSMLSSAEATFKSSNIHFLSDNLENLFKVFDLSQKAVKTIWVNLFLSFIYNVSFGAFALSGLISPLVAVILMPLSSLLVVSITFLSLLGGASK